MSNHGTNLDHINMSSLNHLLRLCEPAAPSASATPIPSPLLATNRSRFYALIIEDHPDVAEAMRCALEKMHVHAMIAHDGATGLQIAAVMHFDLVLLDILMPRMNGFEVCRSLRKLPGLHDLPVMFVSCVTDPEAQKEAAGLGAAHYLCKPFELFELKAHVERILSAEAKRQPTRRDRALKPELRSRG